MSLSIRRAARTAKKVGKRALFYVQQGYALAALPFPNYHVFDSVRQKVRSYPIITERGCPYHCVFCLSAHIWKRKWRSRSPENVVEEIKSAKREYDIETLSMWDDNFTLPSPAAKARAKRICDLIIAEDLGLNIILPNGVRADSIDEELLLKLRRAGCSFMMMGVEDAAPETFGYVKKGETLDDIRGAVAMIRGVGIRVEASMVIGLINATYQSTLKSLRFLDELNVKAHWVIAVPFPNTELYDWVASKGRKLLDISEGIDQCMVMYPPPVVFETPEFTKSERLDAFKLTNTKSKNHLFLYNNKDSIFRNIGRILNIAWKYDRDRFPEHLVHVKTIGRHWILFKLLKARTLTA